MTHPFSVCMHSSTRNLHGKQALPLSPLFCLRYSFCNLSTPCWLALSRLFTLQFGILLIFPRTQFTCSPLRSDHNPIVQSEHPATRGVGTVCLIIQNLPLATCGHLSAKEMMFSSDSINKRLVKGTEVTPVGLTLLKTCFLSVPAVFMWVCARSIQSNPHTHYTVSRTQLPISRFGLKILFCFSTQGLLISHFMALFRAVTATRN